MSIKLCFIDTETGGFIPEKNGLIQVAGIIDIDGEIKEEFNFKMKPPKHKVIEPEALKVNNLTMEDIDSYPHSDEVFRKFRQLLKKYVDSHNPKDKFNFLAYNAPFDTGFIRRWFLDHADKYYGSLFFRYAIDVATIAMQALIKERHLLTNDKLETCIKRFDVKVDGNLHDALVDIKATREVYYKALTMIKGLNEQTEMF